MKHRATVLGGLMLAASIGASPIAAQVTLIDGTFTGGSSFATTVTAKLTYLAGVLTLDITNVGSGAGEVYAAVGIVNLPPGTATPGTAPAGWTWETTQQFSGAALPEGAWAWVAPNPKPHRGLQEGQSATFTYDIGALDYENVGFGVHAISGPNDCSTKFGVWDGGSSQSATNRQEAAECGVSVPEPESAALLLTGLIGLGYVAARRRREDLV